MSLAQLVETMHKICKVWGSNPGHHKKKKLHFKLQQCNLTLAERLDDAVPDLDEPCFAMHLCFFPLID